MLASTHTRCRSHLKGPARQRRRRHPSSSWEWCGWPMRRGSCRMGYGSVSSRCCRRWSDVPGSQAASVCPTGKRCKGFSSYCTPAWRHLPLELGFGSGSTCYRRLDEWQQAGVWQRLHALLLAELRTVGENRVVAGRAGFESRAGEKGGSETGPSPVDRARNGSKQHLLVDATGIPLAWRLTGSNRNDVTQLIPLIDAVPAVRGRVGRPRRRPERLAADRGYDHEKYRRQLRRRGITPEIARRQASTAPGSAATAGSSSAPSPGSITSSGYLCATTAAPKSMKRSLRSDAASSASG